MTTIKDRLKAGKTVVGTAGSIATDVAVLADAGFDFLIFDTQHTPVEIKQLKPGLDAVRGKKATPIVRVSDNRPDLICFALDLGARGIVVPMVNTKAEATAIVRACRYSPLGDRSNAGVRGEWGEHRNYRDYMDHVNSELLIIPMIETKPRLKLSTTSSASTASTCCSSALPIYRSSLMFRSSTSHPNTREASTRLRTCAGSEGSSRGCTSYRRR